MAENTLGSFSGYRQMVTDVRDNLLKLQDYSEALELSQNMASIKDVLEKSSNDVFSVAVIGEFKRGNPPSSTRFWNRMSSQPTQCPPQLP